VGKQGNQPGAGYDGTNRSHGGDRAHEEGINTHILSHSIPQIWSRRIPRPLLPSLLGEKPIGAHRKQGQDDDFTTYSREY